MLNSNKFFVFFCVLLVLNASCGLTKVETGSDAQSAPNAKKFFVSQEVKGCRTNASQGSKEIVSSNDLFSNKIYEEKCRKVYRAFNQALLQSGEKIPGADNADYERFCSAFNLYLDSAGKKSGWMSKFDFDQASFAVKCPESYRQSEDDSIMSIGAVGKIGTNCVVDGKVVTCANTNETPLKGETDELVK